ncbi:class I adenylate-forming enzyme family protein [Solibacillus isronensis]|uniref:class I adenylate-forming enzyme family protein n=1 Tax=Solibacillus isronensis TaxID=412383 RepID=UPI0009A61A9D|nr:AMP-binding protein [Solibacillus isronensis]
MQQLDFWIAKRAGQTPDKTALIQIETGETWTYKELMQHANGWSSTFSNQQLQQGDRVVTLMENSIESFAILIACRLNELIYVPLNTKLSISELQVVLSDCTPALLITDDTHCERAMQLSPTKFLTCGSSELVEPTTYNWRDEPQLPWMIIYTGGTTGKPKGVVLSYEAVTTNAMNTVISWGLNDKDCTLNYMPLFHTGGINALALPILMAGGTVVIGQKFDPERAVRAINEYKTTVSLFVPTMYQSIIETEYFKQSSFPTVKVFLSGGAPCPKPIYECFQKRGLLFKEGYGLTEAGPNNFSIDAEVAMNKKGAIGKSMLFNEVKIINKEGQQCAEGEVGELCLKGSHVFSHYWKNEEATSETFEDGWLKTGDLAKFDEDGDYYIVGRKKEMIITGGENVYPQEVEQCLIAHEAVQEVSVIGIPNEKWGECVVAFVISEDHSEPLQWELLKYCKKHLANYKVPKQIYFLQELPKTVVGKIDKKQLINCVFITE